MRGIIKYLIDVPIAGNILMIFLLVMGLLGALNMKSTFFPTIPSRLIQIQAIYPGASPSEIEEGVVTKIEENLVSVTGVERTTSVSSENAANISIEVIRGYDTDLVLQDVKNAVDRIPTFPAGMEPLVIFKRENVSPALNFSISGNVDLRTLKRYAREIEDDLLEKDAISKVELSGFPEEEIEISFRESDLRSLNLTFSEAAIAVAGANLEATGGIIKSEKEELIIRADSKQYFAQDFENIVLRSNSEGGVIRLHQVADVKDSWEDSPVRSYLNNQPSVIINVNNTDEEDMIPIAAMVKEYIDEFNNSQDEITATVIQDQAKYLNTRLSFLKENGAIGFLIVLVLLAMFLHWRLAFWVALAIPISFAGMFICAEYFGTTYNVISSFGMIVVIGILVDDGIVIAESIYQKYEQGMEANAAALEGTMEVLPAVFSAILTTCVAFGIFFFIEGGLGDAFGAMAVVVIFSLLFSLVEGALILPAHIAHSKALKQDKSKGNLLTLYLDKFMNFLRSTIYGPLLKWSMNYSFPTLAICITGLIIFVGAFKGGVVRSTFFPVIPSDLFTVTLELESGMRESRTEEILDYIQEATWEVNEEFKDKYSLGDKNIIEKVQKSIGPTTNAGVLNVYLLDGEERLDINNRTIIGAIRDKVGPISDAEKLSFGSGNLFGAAVSVSLLSKNEGELTAAAEELKASLRQIDDLTDIADSNQEGNKEIELVLKPKAYNLGFTLRDIIVYVRQGFFGAEVQRIQRGEDEVKVWVRYALDNRNEVSDLSNMRIRTAEGQSVPLSELVEFRTERGVVTINHIEGQREIRVTADLVNDRASVSDINTDIQSILLPKILEKYPSVSVGFEGQQRENEKSQRSMQKVLPLAFMIMFFIIVLTFKSISQTLIVFALMPFAFIGVGLGHYLMDIPISLFSVLGSIALIGIFVNDALVFITTFNNNIAKGIDFKTALYDTGLSRFRPITLTSITTIAGLAPLLLEQSLQAQFLIPMAVSVAFGLMVGTFILLVLIPALLVISNRIKRTALGLWEGEKIDYLMVEPASATRVSNLPIYLIAALITLAALVAYVVFTFKVSELIV